MQELLIAVARGLVEDKDAVQVTVDPAREDGTVVYHLTVAEGASRPESDIWRCPR